MHEVVGHVTADALVAFARREKATQLVLGASRRSRWQELLHGSFVAQGDPARRRHRRPRHRRPRTSTAPPRQRRAARDDVQPSAATTHGVAADGGRAAAADCCVTVAVPRARIALSTVLLLFLTVVLVIAAIGGRVVRGRRRGRRVAAGQLVLRHAVQHAHDRRGREPRQLAGVRRRGGHGRVAGRHRLATCARGAAGPRRGDGAGPIGGDDWPPTPIRCPLARTDPLARSGWSRRGWIPTASLSSWLRHVAGRWSTQPRHDAGRRRHGVRQWHRLELVRRSLSDDDHECCASSPTSWRWRSNGALGRRGRRGRRARRDRRRAHGAAARGVARPAHAARLDQGDGVGTARSDVQVEAGSDREAHATIDEETDRLNRLVGNLLDASRLQIGALAVELPTDDVAESTARPLPASATARSHRVDVPDGCRR